MAEQHGYSSKMCDCAQDPGTCLAVFAFPALTLGQLYTKVTKKRKCVTITLLFAVLSLTASSFSFESRQSKKMATCISELHEKDVYFPSGTFKQDIPKDQRCQLPSGSDWNPTDKDDAEQAASVCENELGFCVTEDERETHRIIEIVFSSLAGLLWLGELIFTIFIIIELRSKFRTEAKIPGSCMEDCCCMFWCYPCVASQMMRHLGISGNTNYSMFSETGELEPLTKKQGDLPVASVVSSSK